MPDPSPNGQVFEAVYGRLRALAETKINAGLGGRSLDATGVVHEVWLKLSESPATAGLSESHYYATAAQAMRWILVDRARRRRSQTISTRFGESLLSPETPSAEADPDEELLGLDRALTALEKVHPRKAAVVGHRYFAGLSIEETARALDISPATVKREWSFARAWMIRELEE